jgi:hypothetical protein
VARPRRLRRKGRRLAGERRNKSTRLLRARSALATFVASAIGRAERTPRRSIKSPTFSSSALSFLIRALQNSAGFLPDEAAS